MNFLITLIPTLTKTQKDIELNNSNVENDLPKLADLATSFT